MHTHQPGVFAALVTPLNEDESVDLESLERPVEWVLKGGIKGIFFGSSIAEGAAFLDRTRVDTRIFDAPGS
jgi:dihydrodipicolinate synthase/N-acetylneuraminate lyase